jgi:hypothetical protein
MFGWRALRWMFFVKKWTVFVTGRRKRRRVGGCLDKKGVVVKE